MSKLSLSILKYCVSPKTIKIHMTALALDSDTASIFAILKLPPTYHGDLPCARFSHVCDLYLMLAYGTLSLSLQPYFRTHLILLIVGSMYLALQIILCIILLSRQLARELEANLTTALPLLKVTIQL